MENLYTWLFWVGTASERAAFTPDTVGSRFFTLDTQKLAVWTGSNWIEIGPGTGGMAQHGNEWHTPDFAEAGSGGGGGNLDGGLPDTNYGGITPIDGGNP